MAIDDLVRISSLAMPLLLGVSAAIAVIVYRFTRRQAQVATLTLVHSRWHEINFGIMRQPHIQRLLGDARFADKTDDEIVVYNFLFQILNTCYELHFAAARGLVDRQIAQRFLAGNADVLRGRRAEVLDMLSWNRGYDPVFCADLRARLA